MTLWLKCIWLVTMSYPEIALTTIHVWSLYLLGRVQSGQHIVWGKGLTIGTSSKSNKNSKIYLYCVHLMKITHADSKRNLRMCIILLGIIMSVTAMLPTTSWQKIPRKVPRCPQHQHTTPAHLSSPLKCYIRPQYHSCSWSDTAPANHSPCCALCAIAYELPPA